VIGGIIVYQILIHRRVPPPARLRHAGKAIG
jgi:hypothetical protein